MLAFLYHTYGSVMGNRWYCHFFACVDSVVKSPLGMASMGWKNRETRIWLVGQAFCKPVNQIICIYIYYIVYMTWLCILYTWHYIHMTIYIYDSILIYLYIYSHPPQRPPTCYLYGFTHIYIYLNGKQNAWPTMLFAIMDCDAGHGNGWNTSGHGLIVRILHMRLLADYGGDWLPSILFFHEYWVSNFIPIDEVIFFRGVANNHQPVGDYELAHERDTHLPTSTINVMGWDGLLINGLCFFFSGKSTDNLRVKSQANLRGSCFLFPTSVKPSHWLFGISLCS